jgi:hypothetical protein
LRGDVSESAKAVRRGETPFDADTGLLGGDVEEVIVNRIEAQDYLARDPPQCLGHRPKPLHTRPVEDDSAPNSGEAIGAFRRDKAPWGAEEGRADAPRAYRSGRHDKRCRDKKTPACARRNRHDCCPRFFRRDYAFNAFALLTQKLIAPVAGH